MVGVVVDAQRMHVTKDHWSELLTKLSELVGKPIDEIHTRDFYSGNGVWRGMKGPERSKVITEVFNWLTERRHHIVYAGVDKVLYFKDLKDGKIPKELNTPWRFMGMHLLLSVQKIHQTQDKNKGHTIFVFDNEEREKMRFTDLVNNPPKWTDSYYNKDKNHASLDQIVDVPYFADSKEVTLLQVADFIAYFLRRYAEISSGYSEPKYPDELAKLNTWIATLRDRCLGGSMMFPLKSRHDCVKLFFNYAPVVVRELHRTQ